MNKKGYLALAAFGVGAVGLMGSAQAGPLPHVSVLKDGAPSGLVQNVYLRRHCYWHHGRRWCPRRYAYDYDYYSYPYYYAPGVFFRFHHHHHDEGHEGHEGHAAYRAYRAEVPRAEGHYGAPHVEGHAGHAMSAPSVSGHAAGPVGGGGKH